MITTRRTAPKAVHSTCLFDKALSLAFTMPYEETRAHARDLLTRRSGNFYMEKKVQALHYSRSRPSRAKNLPPGFSVYRCRDAVGTKGLTGSRWISNCGLVSNDEPVVAGLAQHHEADAHVLARAVGGTVAGDGIGKMV